MAECFQAANGVSLVVGSNEMQFAVGAFYQTWLALCAPEEQPMVINHKTMFMGYLNSQKTLWGSQFGADSLQTLEMIRSMLMEQCCTLCPIVDGLQNAE